MLNKTEAAKVANKAICIAVRTYFADAIGHEHAIWEWLCETEDADADADCPYPIWDCVSELNLPELFEVVDTLRCDIIRSMGELNV